MQDMADQAPAYNTGRAVHSLRSWPYGSFASGHAACMSKRRALRRMSAAHETLAAIKQV